MDINQFAKLHSVPILNSKSEFPSFYAVHAIDNIDILNEKYLLSSELLGHRKLSAEIDKFLGETNYVFFSLGKGYLETKNSMGLIYDPFIIAKDTGANLVLNDILYELDKTNILPEFFVSHRAKIDFIIPVAESKNFWKIVNSNQSLLRVDLKDADQILAAETFENILIHMPKDLQNELAEILKMKIVVPYTMTEGLEEKIKEIFRNDSKFINSFSDQLTEERMTEIRVPGRYALTKGLIGIYCS